MRRRERVRQRVPDMQSDTLREHVRSMSADTCSDTLTAPAERVRMCAPPPRTKSGRGPRRTRSAASWPQDQSHPDMSADTLADTCPDMSPDTFSGHAERTRSAMLSGGAHDA